ncbi:MAG: dihydropteroate synthase [Pseudomonadota bacterium]
MNSYFDCGRYRFAMQGKQFRPLVMGILNITPDSFSDGGQHQALDSAITHAEQMIEDGVDIIDIGGESTRPGAQLLPLEEELRRVMPVIYALRDCGKPLSIDTYKPEVMREAILAGVDLINDITGFRSEAAVQAVAQSDVALCVMHMQNTPSDMQLKPEYQDVNQEVMDFLQARVDALIAAGVERGRISIDPGFGFGKTLQHNVAMLKNIGKFQQQLQLPVLAGMSRKSMIGAITGKPVEHRMAGSVGAALAAVAHGAKIVRVHDVAETVDALKAWQALSS